MAYQEPKTQRWVIEQGDLVYWREDVEAEDRHYPRARVVYITDRHVYLEAGIGKTKRTWYILLGAAPLHIVPREACWLRGSKVYFDWSRPPIVPSGYRKAS